MVVNEKILTAKISQSTVYVEHNWACYGDFNVCILCISLKMLCSKVLVTFADHLCLLVLVGELTMEKGDSNGFYSSRVVCRIFN